MGSQCNKGATSGCDGSLAWYGDAGRSERPRWIYDADDFGGVCAGDEDEGLCGGEA